MLVYLHTSSKCYWDLHLLFLDPEILLNVVHFSRGESLRDALFVVYVIESSTYYQIARQKTRHVAISRIVHRCLSVKSWNVFHWTHKSEIWRRTITKITASTQNDMILKSLNWHVFQTSSIITLRIKFMFRPSPMQQIIGKVLLEFPEKENIILMIFYCSSIKFDFLEFASKFRFFKLLNRYLRRRWNHIRQTLSHISLLFSRRFNYLLSSKSLNNFTLQSQRLNRTDQSLSIADIKFLWVFKLYWRSNISFLIDSSYKSFRFKNKNEDLTHLMQ